MELTLWVIQPVQGERAMTGSCWVVGTHLHDHLFHSTSHLFLLTRFYISDRCLFSKLDWSFYFFWNVVFLSSMFWFFFPSSLKQAQAFYLRSEMKLINISWEDLKDYGCYQLVQEAFSDLDFGPDVQCWCLFFHKWQ